MSVPFVRVVSNPPGIGGGCVAPSVIDFRQENATNITRTMGTNPAKILFFTGVGLRQQNRNFSWNFQALSVFSDARKLMIYTHIYKRHSLL